jgi:hypothetical protein
LRRALDRVPAELVAQRRQHAVGEVAVAAGAKALIERRGDHRCRHVVGGGVLDRPATLARVLGVALDRFQSIAVRLECAGRQFAQPRAHDRALTPEVGDLRVVELVLALVEHVEALSVGLHEPVLDAVVDHLHVVAGARVAEAQPAARTDRRRALLVRGRRQHVEDRCKALDRFRRSSDHHAVADFQPPYTTARADVHIFDAAGFQFRRAALVVRPLGVAAVDDRVAAVEQLGELVDGLLRRRARGDHDPDHARSLELPDEILQRARARCAVLDRLLDRLLVEVERDDLVLGVTTDAVHHVPAHLAEPDETDLGHICSLMLAGRARGALGGDVGICAGTLRAASITPRS